MVRASIPKNPHSKQEIGHDCNPFRVTVFPTIIDTNLDGSLAENHTKQHLSQPFSSGLTFHFVVHENLEVDCGIAKTTFRLTTYKQREFDLTLPSAETHLAHVVD